MRRLSYVICPNCGRTTFRDDSCRWCKHPILLGRQKKPGEARRLTEKEQVSAQRQPRFYYGYIVVIAACLILTITQGTFYSFGVFFKPLAADFGWTRAMTSGAFSLCLMLCGSLFILTGRLNDTIGPRIVVTICSLFLGAGYILMSQIGMLWQLYLFYGIIIAIGMSCGYIPMLSTASRWFVKRRGLMTGVVAAGTGFGTLFVPPIASWLISTYDWRQSYLIVGIGATLLLILIAQFLKRDPTQIGQLPDGQVKLDNNVKQKAIGLSVRQAVRTKRFWIYTVSVFCFGFCLWALLAHIVPHVTDVGLSSTEGAYVLAIIGGSGIIGRIAIGGLADRIGNKLTFAISFVLFCADLVILLSAHQVWHFYIFAIIFGIAYGGWATIIGPIVADLFGIRSHGTLLGSSTLGATIGGAIGPIVAGYIFDMTGDYQLAFILFIVLTLIGLLAVLLLKVPTYNELVKASGS